MRIPEPTAERLLAPRQQAATEFPALMWQRVALALSSGGLLSLSYVFPHFFLTAWFGFVPLLLAVRNATIRESYLLGLLAGIALYTGATHWVTSFIMTLKGYGAVASFLMGSLFWFYSAQAIGLIAALFTWLRRVPVSPVLIFPVTTVAICIAFPTMFTTRMGETQSHFLPAIQAIEFTGLYGLDFVIALTNVLLFVVLVRPRAHRRAATVAATILTAWFGYGLYATIDWDRKIAGWEKIRVGVVQPNEPPSIGIPPPRPGYSRSYPPEIPTTKALAAAGADVVIWPETRFKGYFEYDYVRTAFQNQLAPLKTPVLLHDMERVYGPGDRREYNSVAFVDRGGKFAGTYRKIQLVPFGEYLPLATYFPALRRWVQDFFAFYQVDAGTTPQAFQMGKFSLVPLICYEIAFPMLVAEAFAGQPQGKILVAMSNDTWFGNSRQPFMHGYTSALRAVEHRVPLIHVLNNGPSIAVRPDGRFIFRGDFQQAAGYLVQVPYSPTSGGTFFTRYPYWFISTLYLLMTAIVLVAALDAWDPHHKGRRNRPLGQRTRL